MNNKKALLPLPKMNIFLMLFLYIVTFTLYEPLWYLRRIKKINALKTEKKLDSLLPIFLGILIITQIAYSIFNFNIGSKLSWLLSWLFSVIISINVRNIIVEHLQAKLPVFSRFSWFFVFLFRFFYLQHKINWESEKIIC